MSKNLNDQYEIAKRLLDTSLLDTKPKVITDTTANTAMTGYAIYAISNATFTVFTSGASGNTLIGQTLTAGHIWYIPNISAVTLAGGAVIVYQR